MQSFRTYLERTVKKNIHHKNQVIIPFLTWTFCFVTKTHTYTAQCSTYSVLYCTA